MPYSNESTKQQQTELYTEKFGIPKHTVTSDNIAGEKLAATVIPQTEIRPTELHDFKHPDPDLELPFETHSTKPLNYLDLPDFLKRTEIENHPEAPFDTDDFWADEFANDHGNHTAPAAAETASHNHEPHDSEWGEELGEPHNLEPHDKILLPDFDIAETLHVPETPPLRIPENLTNVEQLIRRDASPKNLTIEKAPIINTPEPEPQPIPTTSVKVDAEPKGKKWWKLGNKNSAPKVEQAPIVAAENAVEKKPNLLSRFNKKINTPEPQPSLTASVEIDAEPKGKKWWKFGKEKTPSLDLETAKVADAVENTAKESGLLSRAWNGMKFWEQETQSQKIDPTITTATTAEAETAVIEPLKTTIHPQSSSLLKDMGLQPELSRKEKEAANPLLKKMRLNSKDIQSSTKPAANTPAPAPAPTHSSVETSTVKETTTIEAEKAGTWLESLGKNAAKIPEAWHEAGIGTKGLVILGASAVLGAVIGEYGKNKSSSKVANLNDERATANLASFASNQI